MEGRCEWKYKLLGHEMNKANGGKVESCIKIKDGNDRLALGEVEEQMIWKEY